MKQVTRAAVEKTIFFTFILVYFVIPVGSSSYFLSVRSAPNTNAVMIERVVTVSDKEIWITLLDMEKYETSIRVTIDGGKSWEPVFFSNAYIIDFKVIGDWVWVYGADKENNSLLFSSKDRGKTWERKQLQAKGMLYKGAFFDGERGWIFNKEMRLAPIFNGEPSANFYVINAMRNIEAFEVQSVGDLWVATEDGSFFQSKNGGRHWDRRPDITALINKFRKGGIIEPRSIKFINDKRGYIATQILVKTKNGNDGFYYGAILITEDGGTSWKLKATPTREGLHILSVVSDNDLWLSPTGSSETDHLFHSLDGGQSWNKVPFPDGFHHVTNMSFSSSLNGIVVHSLGTWDNQLFLTQDGGKTWKLIYPKDGQHRIN